MGGAGTNPTGPTLTLYLLKSPSLELTSPAGDGFGCSFGFSGVLFLPFFPFFPLFSEEKKTHVFQEIRQQKISSNF